MKIKVIRKNKNFKQPKIKAKFLASHRGFELGHDPDFGSVYGL